MTDKRHAQAAWLAAAVEHMDLEVIGRRTIQREETTVAKHTEWCGELEAALAEPFPRDLHTAKGNKGTFVSVRHYVDRLNELVGVNGWSMPTPQSYHAGSKLGLMVGVTILGVTKWNVGDEMEDHGEPDEDGKVRDFGSSSTNSFAQGFKRCLAYGFRLGGYLYDKDWTKAYLAGRAEPQRAASPKVRERVSELIAQLADPALKLTPAQNRTVKIASSLADAKDADPTHLAEAVKRLEKLAASVTSTNGAHA